MESASPDTLIRSLRAATRADHLAIDALMSNIDLSCRQGYGLFLNIHHSALREFEADCRDEDRSDFSAMARCLHDDLDAMGIAAVHSTPTLARLSTANRLGAAYVLRGSRLGARVLRKRIAPQFSASYLNFAPGMSWPEFLRDLEKFSLNSAPAAHRGAIRGAGIAFDVFAGLAALTPPSPA